MNYLIIKTILTAIIIVTVSEVAKRSSLLAAIILSIPFTSLLAFIWLYWDTKNINKIINLSYNTLIMAIPSFVFFLILPILLKLKISFSVSMLISILFTSVTYFVFIYTLKKYGITI
tara:strand:- start:283 stop:633 length:351 start_codon:yes stop_codon:yes gene_type:complete